jgi:proline iminopeptidase
VTASEEGWERSAIEWDRSVLPRVGNHKCAASVITRMRYIAAPCIALFLVAGSIHAQRSAQRIEAASFMTIGGIEQWVTLRGDDRDNPVLLLLHGGPGDVQSPFVSTYAPYEKDFVLVQWDQRGAGRTFAKNGAAGVTRESLIADGLDLAGQLHTRFPRAPLILFGHSWGSIIATGMAQRRPEWFAAYVGTGQVSSWADTVQFQFDFLKQRYKEKGDTASLAALDAIGKPDPNDLTQYFGFSRPIRQFMTASDTAWLSGLRTIYKANGESEEMVKAIGDGMSASGSALNGASLDRDLATTATRFKLPYYVIQGRHDLFAPTPLVEAYFNKVSAPKKRLIIIEDAGHFALATHQAELIAALKAVIQ